MDANRFDVLTKTFTERRLSRRTALASAAAGLAVTGLAHLGLRQAVAQDASPAASPAAEPGFGQEYLFVQTFGGGTWQPKTGEQGAYTLTLTGGTAQTVYFSDRPERIVGTTPMQQFLDGLGFTPNNPPNAALVTQTNGDEDVLVIELLNPVYDAAGGTLTYDARVLEDYQGEGLAFVAARRDDATLPEQFGAASLFIDDCPDIVNCYREAQGIPQQVGALPGGPIGTCWHTKDLQCLPCNGESLSYYGNICNNTYPDACNGGCSVFNA